MDTILSILLLIVFGIPFVLLSILIMPFVLLINKFFPPKFLRQKLTLEEFLEQLQLIKRMERIDQSYPKPETLTREQKLDETDKRILHTEAIILSMTKQERTTPHMLCSSRINRISLGCGISVGKVQHLLSEIKPLLKTNISSFYWEEECL